MLGARHGTSSDSPVAFAAAPLVDRCVGCPDRAWTLGAQRKTGRAGTRLSRNLVISTSACCLLPVARDAATCEESCPAASQAAIPKRTLLSVRQIQFGVQVREWKRSSLGPCRYLRPTLPPFWQGPNLLGNLASSLALPPRAARSPHPSPALFLIAFLTSDFLIVYLTDPLPTQISCSRASGAPADLTERWKRPAGAAFYQQPNQDPAIVTCAPSRLSDP